MVAKLKMSYGDQPKMRLCLLVITVVLLVSLLLTEYIHLGFGEFSMQWAGGCATRWYN